MGIMHPDTAKATGSAPGESVSIAARSAPFDELKAHGMLFGCQDPFEPEICIKDSGGHGIMNTQLLLQNQVALVTGAGSGIGRAAAKRFCEQGANVGIMSRHEEDLRDLAQEARDDPGTIFVVPGDISKEDSISGGIDKLVDRFGSLDIVFANAGVNGTWAPIDELEPDEFRKTVNINLIGTYLTIRYSVPHLKRNGGGSIIVTSSVNGNRKFTTAGATAYSATKAAQVAIVKQLAVELGQDHIRVNAVCPGAIKTEIGSRTEKKDIEHAVPEVHFPEGNIPLTHGKPGTSDEVAQVVLFLASDKSKHVSGADIYVDGAQSLLQG